MDAIEIRWLNDKAAAADILIEGLPGIGHVGKLVAEHMIQEFHAEKIAEVHSIHFPPQVIIEPDGIARLARNEVYVSGGEKRFAFLVGDYQSASAEGHYLLAEAYLDIAERLGVRRIYTLGGYGVGHLVSGPRVLSAVNRDELRADVESAGAEFEPGRAPGRDHRRLGASPGPLPPAWNGCHLPDGGDERVPGRPAGCVGASHRALGPHRGRG